MDELHDYMHALLSLCFNLFLQSCAMLSIHVVSTTEILVISSLLLLGIGIACQKEGTFFNQKYFSTIKTTANFSQTFTICLII
jgi:hypothetical protein